MNYSHFNISRDRARGLLKDFGALSKEWLRDPEVLPGFIDATKKNDHKHIYDKAMELKNYDFILTDGSIFQFDFRENPTNGNSARYAFYQFPYDCETYEQFLLSEDSSYRVMGEELREEYNQKATEAGIIPYPVSFRYDLAYSSYLECVHSASHMHFGMQNSIRVPLSRILTPYAFTIFILRQVYYGEWKKFSATHGFMDAVRYTKTSSSPLEAAHFSDTEKTQIHMT